MYNEGRKRPRYFRRVAGIGGYCGSENFIWEIETENNFDLSVNFINYRR